MTPGNQVQFETVSRQIISVDIVFISATTACQRVGHELANLKRKYFVFAALMVN